MISHAVVGLAIGACFYESRIPKHVWVIGAACSALPDLDVIGFQFGVKYADFWGHRGFMHSLVFAALVALVIVVFGFRRGVPGMRPLFLWVYFFLACASHGALDAMTDGGLGVALLSPIDNHRYFFPWRPIHVSPIGLNRFFSARGEVVLQNEFVWIWVPALILALCGLALRQGIAGGRRESPEG
jgi:inner membrane protein